MTTADFQRDAEIVHDGFVTPHSATMAVDGKQEVAGCVYHADGRKSAQSERYSGHEGDRVRTTNPDRMTPPKDARRVPGRGVYLGHFMGGYYGHFITETLSTLWIFEEQPAAEFDYFLFHPFTSGRKMTDAARYCFERFGMDPARIIFADEGPLQVEELVVPERLLRLNHSADVRLRSVYERITADVRGSAPPTERVYLSRRSLNRTKFERVTANEVRIERLFDRRGFSIVYPERLAFAEQLRLYSNAATIAGSSGSSLHNSIFARPGTEVIELGDPRYGGRRAPTQVLCDQVSGVQNTLIPFAGRRFGPKRTMLFSTKAIEAGLDSALTPVEAPPPAADLSWLKDAPEVIYRSLRPTAGHIARQVTGILR